MIRYSRRWIEPERYLSRWLDPRVRSLKVADVTAYLLSRGWKSVEADRPNTLVFQEPPGRDGPPLYQFVPSSENLGDYDWRMIELITLLAFFEDRQPVAILDDILHDRPGANGIPADKLQGTEAVPRQ